MNNPAGALVLNELTSIHSEFKSLLDQEDTPSIERFELFPTMGALTPDNRRIFPYTIQCLELITIWANTNYRAGLMVGGSIVLIIRSNTIPPVIKIPYLGLIPNGVPVAIVDVLSPGYPVITDATELSYAYIVGYIQ